MFILLQETQGFVNRPKFLLQLSRFLQTHTKHFRYKGMTTHQEKGKFQKTLYAELLFCCFILIISFHYQHIYVKRERPVVCTSVH